MAQFRIYSNSNEGTKAEFPYLLDVQSNLLSELATRVVIPLVTFSNPKYKAMTRLTPAIEIKGRKHRAITSLMAGVPRSALGNEIADISQQRVDIVAAVDLLITGF
jgi:toxin CcdB